MTIAAKNLTLTVTTGPLPASRKIHIPGDIHGDIRVPMREISVHPTAGEPPVIVYDSSGPYTIEGAEIRIEQGLSPLRRDWVLARGDVEAYDGRHEVDGFCLIFAQPTLIGWVCDILRTDYGPDHAWRPVCLDAVTVSSSADPIAAAKFGGV